MNRMPKQRSMRRMRIAICLVLALAGGACKKDKGAETGGSGSATGGGSGSATAGSSGGGSGSETVSSSGGSGSGSSTGSGDHTGMSHHAGNCPSTVLDSTTKAELKDKAVIVTVSSDNKDAQLAIQKRTDALISEHQEKKTPTAGHDRSGTHGGRTGLCPIHIPEGATVDAKHTDQGVEVTITPKDKPDELKKDIDERIARAADWVKQNIKPGDKGNQGGTGGGKAEEGMNRSGSGDAHGMDRKKGSGEGGGKGTGGGGGKGTGGGGSKDKDKKDSAKQTAPGGGW
jgi:hypothetical protein